MVAGKGLRYTIHDTASKYPEQAYELGKKLK